MTAIFGERGTPGSVFVEPVSWLRLAEFIFVLEHIHSFGWRRQYDWLCPNCHFCCAAWLQSSGIGRNPAVDGGPFLTLPLVYSEFIIISQDSTGG